MLFFLGVGYCWKLEKKERVYLDEMVKDGLKVLVGAVVEGVEGLGALDRKRLAYRSGFKLWQQNSPETSISSPTAP